MTKVYALEPRFRVLRSRILRLTKKLFRLTGTAGGCNIYLLGDRFMKRSGRELRKMYAQAKRVPLLRAPHSFNVLAFPSVPSFPDPESRKSLGDIYLHVDHLKKRGDSVEHMLIHGFLHLIGFSHGRRNDRIAMEKMETKLWRDIFLQR